MYFTLELSNFDLHIILYIALKLYKIEWLISPECGHLNSYLAREGGHVEASIWPVYLHNNNFKAKCYGEPFVPKLQIVIVELQS